MHIYQNPDTEYVQEIKKRIKDNGGYCPCRLIKAPETKCMCKDFTDACDRGEEGMCMCGLYIAERN